MIKKPWSVYSDEMFLLPPVTSLCMQLIQPSHQSVVMKGSEEWSACMHIAKDAVLCYLKKIAKSVMSDKNNGLNSDGYFHIKYIFSSFLKACLCIAYGWRNYIRPV